ncbi:hypothetical protein QJ043_02175 [Olsenella sp. YH-ols2217]|uniref:Uncharacterized protein n=1 Tax=Kribbibacterium absianum TaxID=3044210 RepID=A0ABT6ZJB0_9ACTN|nr:MULTISPECIES: hypothetical protein [unclassified Olsenella]MDJ1121399.1 hypothetical protein [Olsenella sp. YH-ols2216]MDJ1128889.1 hypothetical protein [Olsenella sp. YH-ols2217]
MTDDRHATVTRRQALALAAASVGSLITATPALAHLTDDDSATNSFVAANNVIEVQEEFDPKPDPSGSVRKVARARNTGNCDCWVRGLVAVSSTEDVTAVEYNGAAWDRNDDGWWYYGHPLAPGALSDPLMTGAKATTGSTITVCLESCSTAFGDEPVSAFARVGKEL